jgi:hypothetical protein
VNPVRRIFVIDAHLVIAALDMSGLLMQTQIKEIGDHNMSADLNGRSLRWHTTWPASLAH